jgi:mono/diheme cytochrome c family protein
MKRIDWTLLPVICALAIFDSAPAVAQPPGAAVPYPQRDTDPAAVARGKQIYDTYGCSFCHGADIHGGAGGPSLLRSSLVQNDERGELIGAVIRSGRPNTTMVGFALDDAQVADLAEFFNSFSLSSREVGRVQPETIVTGNAGAGRRYFNRNCGGCHATDGDLSGIASRITDPRELQQTWLMPRDAPPVTATIEIDGGTRSGELVRIDEFLVTIRTADGLQRTFKREGDVPRVVRHDPLEAHKALLSQYTDPDIHNVTAYLVTIR